MNKKSYFIGFFIIVVLIAVLEFLVSPPKVFEGSDSFYATEQESGKDVSAQMKKILSDSSALQAFAAVGVMVRPTVSSVEVNHVFQLFPFSHVQNSFRVFKTAYSLPQADDTLEKYVVLYDIYSTKPRTTLESYADVKNIVQENLDRDIETRVIEHNRYGQKSFSLKRVVDEQKVMYLVVAYRDRLLGIEYPLSRHGEMEKVFTKLFQQ